MNRASLRHQLGVLKSKGFGINLWEDFSKVIISGIDLRGDGWTDSDDNPMYSFPALIDIPPDFPLTVPGIGYTHPRYAIHVPLIRYDAYEISHLHDCRHDPWHWFCFEDIEWNPKTDNMISLLQIIELSIYRRR